MEGVELRIQAQQTEIPPKDGCGSLWRGKEDAWRWDEDGEVLSSPAKLPQIWSPRLSSFPSSPPADNNHLTKHEMTISPTTNPEIHPC